MMQGKTFGLDSHIPGFCTSFEKKLYNKKYMYPQIYDFLFEIMKLLIKNLTENGEFKLSPDKNVIHTNSGEYFAEVLKTNSTIKNFDTCCNFYGGNRDSLRNHSETMKFFSEGLKMNKSITILGLCLNEFGLNPESVMMLSEAL